MCRVPDHSIVEIGTIICDDHLGYVIPTYQIILNEPGHNILGNKGKQGYFDPLREVINSDQDEKIPIRSGGLDISNHIDVHVENRKGVIKKFKGNGGTYTL